ncbi:MAG: hypothetical protein II453_02050 [Alphaproteobacteria bacterium]|nr:hypothetical protein [Alphaproteobacteria bacterium]
MKEKIESKINEIIETILAKNPHEITYSEYKILDCRYKDLKYFEEQKKRNEEMTQLMAKSIGYCYGGLEHLPEPEIKEE